jgi:phosphoglycerate dehydrogenase-like enzyme
LEEVLKQSDFVSLHLPLNESSLNLIDKKALALMKPTAFLINTARGRIVNEADLAEALHSKKLAGAGIDVLENEPPEPHNPLLKVENVVLTAHTAGIDLEARDAMSLTAAQCIAKLSRGEWPAECIVNPEVKSRFKWKS